MAIKQFGKRIEQIVHRINFVLVIVGMIVLFFMMLVQTTDVLGRYLFDAPLKVTMDLIELGMGVLVFFALPYCASVNEHIRVDLVLVHLSKRAQNIIDRCTFGAGAFILALITWRLAVRAWSILHNPPGPVTLTMLVPYWPFVIIATLGTFFFFLEYLIRVFNPASGKSQGPLAQEGSNFETADKNS
jgi:TRAP-type transport system small permease protein